MTQVLRNFKACPKSHTFFCKATSPTGKQVDCPTWALCVCSGLCVPCVLERSCMMISVVENHEWFRSSAEQLLRLPKIPGSEELHTNPLLYHGISVPQRTYSYPLMVWSKISPLGFCFENQWPLTAQFWWLWSLTGRSGVSLWRLFLPLILPFFLCLLFYYDMEKPLIYSHCHRTSSPCHPQIWQTEIPLKQAVQRKLSSHILSDILLQWQESD